MKTRFAATILMIVIMISSPLSAQAAAVTGEGMTDVLRYGPAAAAEKVSAQGRAAAFTSAGLKLCARRQDREGLAERRREMVLPVIRRSYEDGLAERWREMVLPVEERGYEDRLAS